MKIVIVQRKEKPKSKCVQKCARNKWKKKNFFFPCELKKKKNRGRLLFTRFSYSEINLKKNARFAIY